MGRCATKDDATVGPKSAALSTRVGRGEDRRCSGSRGVSRVRPLVGMNLRLRVGWEGRLVRFKRVRARAASGSEAEVASRRYAVFEGSLFAWR